MHDQASRCWKKESHQIFPRHSSKLKKKLEHHFDQHPAFGFDRAVCIFYPHQLPAVGHVIADYGQDIKDLRNPPPELWEEWLIYISTQFKEDALPVPLELTTFWHSMESRFPQLSSIDLDAIWLPVTSVDAESFLSQDKHLLNDQRESLTEENIKKLLMLFYNCDLQGHFDRKV